MTPEARVAAAIDVLDTVVAGQACEQALTRWGRQNRYAGSRDRAAVRDHVYDVMRQRRIAGHLGGGQGGRALMLGLLRHQGIDPGEVFTGTGYGPAALTEEERAFDPGPATEAMQWNMPDWIMPELKRSLGETAEQIAQALQARAPVTLRVNSAKVSREDAQRSLAADQIETVVNSVCDTALSVTEGARRLRQSAAYIDGLVELQDAASQAVVSLMPAGARMLDYCAGGGGKALAMAARGDGTVFAHDAAPERMADLPARAARAGVGITQLSQAQARAKAPFDVVLCDAPCSGSGAWRRAPEGKWQLTQAGLDALTAVQDTILDTAAGLTARRGWLIYATCSVLRCENEDRVAAFLVRHPQWRCAFDRRFAVSDEADGFYTAHLRLEA